MKIHVIHTGEVRVSPYLPFGGENCNLLKASAMRGPWASRLTCLVTAQW